MRFKTLLAFAIIAFVIFRSQHVSAQDINAFKIDNKISILNDKAFFLFPTGAKNIHRGVDIMSADPNANEETRIVLDIGDMRLVFFAQELFSYGDNSLLTTVSKQNKEHSIIKMLTDKDGLSSILLTPTLFDSTQNAILINSLLVKTPDNSIFKISAYINPSAYKSKEKFKDITAKVFSTLTKGIRKTDREARQEKHTIFGTDKSFVFDIPANYCITVDKQYDFQVFKFHKYENFSDTDWISLIIYVGDHPSPIYADNHLSEKDGKIVTGKFINENVGWLLFYIPEQGFFDKEKIINANDIQKGQIVHIAMLSNQRSLIDEMTKIVESIQLDKK